MDYRLIDANDKMKWKVDSPASPEDIDRVLGDKRVSDYTSSGLSSLRSFWSVCGGIEWLGCSFSGKIFSPMDALAGIKKKEWTSPHFGACIPVFDYAGGRQAGMCSDGRIVNLTIDRNAQKVVIAESFDQFIQDLREQKGFVPVYRGDITAQVEFDLMYDPAILLRYFRRFAAMTEHPDSLTFRVTVEEYAWSHVDPDVSQRLLEDCPRIAPVNDALLQLWEFAIGRLAVLHRKQVRIGPASEIEALISDRILFRRSDQQRIAGIENAPTVNDKGHFSLVKAGWAVCYLKKYAASEEIRGKCLRTLERYVGKSGMKGLE